MAHSLLAHGVTWHNSDFVQLKKHSQYLTLYKIRVTRLNMKLNRKLEVCERAMACLKCGVCCHSSCLLSSAACKTHLTARFPNFKQFKVDDLFASLGPLPSFSGDITWSPPRCVLLTRTKGSFGICIRGSKPVKVTHVDPKGSAEVSLFLHNYLCVQLSTW